MGFEKDARRITRVVKEYPEFLQSRADEASAVVTLFKEAAVSRQDLTKALRRQPQILIAKSADLAATLEALRAELPEASATSVVRACPEALLRKSQDVASMASGIRTMGMPLEKVAKRAPRIFFLRSIAELQRVFNFLMNSKTGPGMSKEVAIKVLSSSEALMVARDPATQLAPLVRLLREDLGVDPGAEACLGFYAWPDSFSTIEPAAKFLMEHWPMEDVRANVSLLSHSLEARIRPRTLYAERLKVLRPPIRAVTAVDDTLFSHIVGSSLEKYIDFQMELRKADREADRELRRAERKAARAAGIK